MDAVAFAAAVGGTVVGVAGLFFGWLNSTGQREHERSLARGERFFEARSLAYQELLRYLSRAMLGIERTHPIVGPKPPPPEPPSDEEWTEMFVKVAVAGSEELMSAFERFASKANSFHVYATTYGAMKDQPGEGLAEAATEMNKYRQEASDALRDLERLIRKELAAL